MRFDTPSKSMVRLFVVAVVLMALHKVECWIAAEWTVSPFFAHIIAYAESFGGTTEEILGRAMFGVFVIWLFFGLTIGSLILWGGAGPGIALGIWGLTFLLEWHHVIRTVTSGAYYPGVITAVVYVAFGFVYWQELLRHVHVGDTARTPSKA